MKGWINLLFLSIALSVGVDCPAAARSTTALKAHASAPARQTSLSPKNRTSTLQEALPLLQDGDLIFIRSKHPVFRRVAETTQSWESHVGIIFRSAEGRWLVAESKVPLSKFTPLEKFIRRSENQRFLVERCKGGLSSHDKELLLQSSKARMRKLYDLGFNYDSRRLYCSKFVHDVYADSLGRQVGQVETFRQIILSNPEAPLGFWRLWFLGKIPWERRCITTTSVLHSQNFRTVFDSELVQ